VSRSFEACEVASARWAYDHLQQAGLEVTFGDSPTQAGWDLDIEGQHVNIKVLQDANSLTDHFDKYPDIPVIINADADNIPEGAIYFDPQEGLDPANLLGEHLVVVDQSLLLSEAHDAALDALEVLDSGLEMALPGGFSAVFQLVRSAQRERRLYLEGKTTRERAFRNIVIDVSTRGTLVGLSATASVFDGGVVAEVAETLGASAAAGKLSRLWRTRTLRQAHAALAQAEAMAATGRAYESSQARIRREHESARVEWDKALLLQQQSLGQAASKLETRLHDSVHVEWMQVLASTARDLRARAQALDSEVVDLDFRPKWALRIALKRAIRDWARAAEPLVATAGTSPHDAARFWDHMAAAPAGRIAMTRHIEEALRGRGTAYASFGTAAVRAHASLRRLRAVLESRIRDVIRVAVQQARQTLTEPVRALQQAQDQLRQEIAAAGGSTS
jgi:hypothetical protein